MGYGTDQLSGIDLTRAYSIAPATQRGFGTDVIPFALGQSVTADDESVWLFCLVGEGGITGASYVCGISEDFTARMAPTNDPLGALGVAACEATAGQYVWIQVFGPAQVQVAADCAENVPLYTTTTHGVLDDDDASGYLTGIVIVATNGGEQAAVPGLLNWNVQNGAATVLAIAGNATLSLTVDEAMTPEVYTASGGVPPYTFSSVGDPLPAGLSLSTDGELTGTPTVEDVTDVTIRVTDTAGSTDDLPVEITVAGGGPLTALVDFENAVYTVDGVPVVLGDVIDENLDYGTWNPADIVPGTGIVAPMASFSSPALTGDLLTLALAGCTVVIDFEVSATGSSRVASDFFTSDYSTDYGLLCGDTAVGDVYAFPDGRDDPLPDLATGPHKIAWTITLSKTILSIDGDPVVGGAVTPPSPGDEYTGAGFGVANTGVLRSLTFMQPVDDADLPALSAL